MLWRCCKIMCYQNKVDDIVVTSLDLDVWIKLRLSSHHLTFTCYCRQQIIPPTCPLKNPRTGSDKVSRKANNIVLSCKYKLFGLKCQRLGEKRGPSRAQVTEGRQMRLKKDGVTYLKRTMQFFSCMP